MNLKSQAQVRPIHIPVLTVVFFILFFAKVCGFTTLSWWWITLPLWGPVLLILLIFVIVFIIELVSSTRKKK